MSFNVVFFFFFFSFFSSVSHFVQPSRTILAILNKGHKRNTSTVAITFFLSVYAFGVRFKIVA